MLIRKQLSNAATEWQKSKNTPPFLYAQGSQGDAESEWVPTVCHGKRLEFQKKMDYKFDDRTVNRGVCVCEYVGEEEDPLGVRAYEDDNAWRLVGVFFMRQPKKGESGESAVEKIELSFSSWVNLWYSAFSVDPAVGEFMHRNCVLDLFFEGEKGSEQLKSCQVRCRTEHETHSGAPKPSEVAFSCKFQSPAKECDDSVAIQQSPWNVGQIASITNGASYRDARYRDEPSGDFFYFDGASGFVRVAEHMECSGIHREQRCMFSNLGEYREWSGYTEDSRLNAMIPKDELLENGCITNVFFHSIITLEGDTGSERITKQAINTKLAKCTKKAADGTLEVIDIDVSKVLPVEYGNGYTRFFKGKRGEERMAYCTVPFTGNASILFNGPRFHEMRTGFAYGDGDSRVIYTLRPHESGEPATVTRMLEDHQLPACIQKDPNFMALHGGKLEIVYFLERTLHCKNKGDEPTVFFKCVGVTYAMHPRSSLCPSSSSSPSPSQCFIPRGAIFLDGDAFKERIVKSAFYMDSWTDEPVVRDTSLFADSNGELSSFEKTWYAIHGPRMQDSSVNFESCYRGKRGREMRCADKGAGHTLPIPPEFRELYNHLWNTVRDDTTGDGISKPLRWMHPTPGIETMLPQDAGRDPVRALPGDLLTRQDKCVLDHVDELLGEVADQETNEAEAFAFAADILLTDVGIGDQCEDSDDDDDDDGRDGDDDDVSGITYADGSLRDFVGLYGARRLFDPCCFCCCWPDATGVFLEKTEYSLMQTALETYRDAEIKSGRYIKTLEGNQCKSQELIDSMEETIARLEAEKTLMEANDLQMEKINATLENTIQSLEKKCVKKTHECAQVKTDVAKEKHKCASLYKELTTLQEELTKQIKATEGAKRAQAGSDRRCSALETELSETHKRLDPIQAKYHEFVGAYAKLEKMLADFHKTEECNRLTHENERRRLETELASTRDMYNTEVQRGQDREAELQRLQTLLQQHNGDGMRECSDEDLHRLLDNANRTVCDAQAEIQRRTEQRMQREHERRIAEMQAEHEKQMAETERLHKMRVAEAAAGSSSISCGSMSDSDSECRMSALSSPSPPRSCSPSAEGAIGRPECVYCLDASVEVMLMPCNHMCLCTHCASVEMSIPQASSQKKGKKKKKKGGQKCPDVPPPPLPSPTPCPICSEPVSGYERVYLA